MIDCIKERRYGGFMLLLRPEKTVFDAISRAEEGGLVGGASNSGRTKLISA